MNFIFVSPHFPKTYWNFCDRLHRNGVNVLGIGDAPFDEIPWELKQCLTEYYRVNDLGNYDEMLRAVAYFTFHYGKIDWIESNNEYWLEMDAQLRVIARLSGMQDCPGYVIHTDGEHHQEVALQESPHDAAVYA